MIQCSLVGVAFLYSSYTINVTGICELTIQDQDAKIKNDLIY